MFSSFNRPKSEDFGQKFSKEVPVFKLHTSKNYLVKSGFTNIYDKIQEDLESTNIRLLIERFLNKEIDNREGAVFADVTSYPKSLLDAYNVLTEGEIKFQSMPLDLRDKYGHSFHRFLKEFDGDIAFLDKKDKKIVEKSNLIKEGGDENVSSQIEKKK